MCQSKPLSVVYVIRCKDQTYYIGSSIHFWRRMQEHQDGHCIWTRRHGIDRVMHRLDAPDPAMHGRLENELWMHFARHVCGPENVRGGDIVHTGPIPNWSLPEEFGGKRRCDW